LLRTAPGLRSVAREQLDPDDAGKELELLAAALWPAEDLVRQDLEAG